VRRVEIGGKSFDLPDEVVAELSKKSSGGGGGAAPSLDAIKEKHPWVQGASEVKLIPSGSGFKFGVEVGCQAGRLVRTTSRYTGVDSVIPIRVDHKTAAMRTYDYSGLPECGERITKATSDLHQSHLCDGCKTKLDGGKKRAIQALAKQLQVKAAGELGA